MNLTEAQQQFMEAWLKCIRLNKEFDKAKTELAEAQKKVELEMIK